MVIERFVRIDVGVPCYTHYATVFNVEVREEHIYIVQDHVLRENIAELFARQKNNAGEIFIAFGTHYADKLFLFLVVLAP